jgi:hypothetical protein
MALIQQFMHQHHAALGFGFMQQHDSASNIINMESNQHEIKGMAHSKFMQHNASIKRPQTNMTNTNQCRFSWILKTAAGH